MESRISPPPILPPAARLARALGSPGAFAGSGPAVARLFHRLLAIISLIAWASLGAQIDVLAGSRGLLPAGPYVDALRAAGVSFWKAPTFFLWTSASDAALHGGVAAGIALSLLALAGVAPRLSAAANVALYLGYAVVCRTFLSFQWDNLLLECGLLAALLPRDRPAPWAHLLMRAALFKLYWESGLAKWQSPLHDWHDGSAMTFYYETAPIPARLAFFAHHLPAWWHAFEGWFTLFFELVLAFAIFAPRRPRLVGLAVFTLFQVVDIATVNYGFFCYLALALHVFLLDDADVIAARARLTRVIPGLRRALARARIAAARARRRLAWIRAGSPPLRRAAALAAVTAYLGLSAIEGAAHFSSSPRLLADVAPLRAAVAPLRLVNAYHLFAAVTRDRVEPEIEVHDGSRWVPLDLRYKPGDPRRAPGFVAPHQPRVDFQLWFYGLSYRRGTPAYVEALLDRVCRDPEAVAPLFRDPIPARRAAARVVLRRYHFTTSAERRATGAWWTREQVAAMQPVHCGHSP